LFRASCIALVATAMSFAIRGDIMAISRGSSREQTGVGWIAGAAFWGFGFSILFGGPLCDLSEWVRCSGSPPPATSAGDCDDRRAEFRRPLRGDARHRHRQRPREAASIRSSRHLLRRQNAPARGPPRLVPRGIVIGGVLSFLFTQAGRHAPALAPYTGWQAKMLLLLVPSVAYAFQFAGRRFPPTERGRGGVPFGDMFKQILRPLFVVIWLCMWLTAATELGPGQWVSNIFNDVHEELHAGRHPRARLGERHHVPDAPVPGRRRASHVARWRSLHPPRSPPRRDCSSSARPHARNCVRRRALFAAGVAFGGRRCWASRRAVPARRRAAPGDHRSHRLVLHAIAGPVMGWINDRYGASRVLSMWRYCRRAVAISQPCI